MTVAGPSGVCSTLLLPAVALCTSVLCLGTAVCWLAALADVIIRGVLWQMC